MSNKRPKQRLIDRIVNYRFSFDFFGGQFYAHINYILERKSKREKQRKEKKRDKYKLNWLRKTNQKQ